MTTIKVERYFDLYAKNWDLVKRHPRLHVEPDVPDVFVCPTCFRYFTREDLEHKALTLEHVPPDSLGGKVRTITCKECNNRVGGKLESQLGRKLNFDAFMSGFPGSSQDAAYYLGDNQDLRLPAVVRWTNPETIQLLGVPDRTNPSDMRRLEELLKVIDSKPLDFTIQFRPYTASHPEAALLRIAYLWAFSVLGYGFLINPNLEVIVGQFNNPEKNVLPTWGIVERDFPDGLLGSNIITNPEDLRSYLIVFDLTPPRGSSVRYGVILPNPGRPGLSVYSGLLKQQGVPISLKIRHIPEDLDFVKQPFVSLDLWD